MADLQRDGGETSWTTLNRRQFIRRFGGAAVGLAVLPLLGACTTNTSTPTTLPTETPDTNNQPATPTVSGRRTVQAGTTLNLLLTGSPAPAADDRLRDLALEWGRDHDVTITIETVGEAGLQARLASPSGTTGVDIVGCRDNLPWLHSSLFADLSAEAEELATTFGGYYETAAMQAHVDGVWRAVPFSIIPSAIIYRTDWLKAAGASTFPTNLDDLKALSKTWKAARHPFGAPAGRSAEDPRALWHGVLWGFGGRITEADGKKIAINSAETSAAITWAKEFWNEGCIAEGLLWDDSGNNLAYTNAQIAATLNSPGLYLKLKQEAPAIAAVSALAPFPAGPAGEATPVTTRAHAVLQTAPNPTAARAFLLWLGQREQTERYLAAGAGAFVAALRGFEDSPIWAQDPQLGAFLTAAQQGRWVGWPAKPSQAADTTVNNFIVVDMFANVFAGKNIQLSIGEAESALRGIYPS